VPPAKSRAAVLWSCAALLAAPAFFFPLYNPDLFWHLSAGRWIWTHRALPRADFLSFTAAGEPWGDFEWLAQLSFQAFHCAGGMTGLWLLKIVLLACSCLCLDRLLARRNVGPRLRAAALVLWSAGMLPHGDLRPELFSVLFLSALMWRLEERRLGAAECFLGFSAWACLHPGFLVGLGLFPAYGLEAACRRRWAQAARHARDFTLAGLATLCNPYFLLPHRIAWEHWTMRHDLARAIKEWQPMSLENPLYWPFWPTLILVCVLAAAALRRETRRRPEAPEQAAPWALIAATLYLGASSLGHERGSIFFSAAAAAAIPLLAKDDLFSRRALGACIAVYAAFALWLMPRVSWAGVFNYKFVPRPAAEFMAKERQVLEPLRLYNQWEWGGYLGWRLRPWHRVFQDGRYIFHDLLVGGAEAARSPQAWQKFIDEHKLSGGLMLNLDRMLPAKKRYPDGTLKDFSRPWYVFYMPKARWALVYWDEQALLFVDRRAAPASWLAEHEYRYVRPKDDAAFQEALRLKEIPAAAAAAEEQRHREELKKFGAQAP